MRRAFLVVPMLLATLALVGSVHAASIGWGCDAAFGATDSTGAYLAGDKTKTLDFSAGAYVQLIKQVGDIDPYLEPPGTSIVLVDDIVLDEGHIGYYTFGSGPASGRFWNAGRNVDIDIGDVLYVRAYSVPKDDVASTALGVLEIGVNNNTHDFLGITVSQTMNPENYYFNSLQTEVTVPEPASLLFLVPGLAVWALRRKK